MRKSLYASRVTSSATGVVDDRARELRRQGRRVFNFGAGQPDFPTPAEIAASGIDAIRQGLTRYTSPRGTLELREAIAGKLKRKTGQVYSPATEIFVSGGAKQSIHHLLASVLSPGEEVLVPSPCWVSYPEIIHLLGGEVRFVGTRIDERFRLTPEALRSAIGPRAVGLILNNPCNPTGTVYRSDELRGILRIVRESGLWVIADEIYEEIVFGGTEHVSLAKIGEDLRDRLAIVSGVSKAYSMTGWRIGYATGPEDWVATAASIQSHQAGNACTISQEAARHAITGCDSAVETMRSTFERRRDLVVERLQGIKGLRFVPPEGTFYLFLDVSAFLRGAGSVGDPDSDVDLAAWLLEETGVVTVPGTAFAAKGFLRISFATSEDELDEGLTLMCEALERLGPGGSGHGRQEGKE